MIDLFARAVFIIGGLVACYVIAASLLGAFLKTRSSDPLDRILPMNTKDEEVRRIARGRRKRR